MIFEVEHLCFIKFVVNQAEEAKLPAPSVMATPNDKPEGFPGAFALEVASIGKELVDSFTKFITTRKVQERRMVSPITMN